MTIATIVTTSLDHRVESLRDFNRFYTRRIGVLRESLLDSPFPLTDARVIYELANRGEATASEICRQLAIDAGYLSRILRRFRSQNIVIQRQSETDRRQRLISLTDHGRDAFALLDERSRRENASLLQDLGDGDQQKLLSAMATIQGLLQQNSSQPTAYVLRTHQPGDMGWVVQRHGELNTEEYGWDQTFESLVARVTADFIDDFKPARERCWLAEIDGDVVGSIFVVEKSKTIAKLRLMIVDPRARGMGIGRRLIDEAIRFARRSGYRRMTLWTMNVLLAARHLYKTSGFDLVDEESVFSFGCDLVSETWELNLAPPNSPQ